MLLHVITSLRAGGAERLVAQMLPRLHRAGIACELALLDGTRTPFLEEVERAGITIHSLGIGLKGVYSPRHILRLRSLMKRADIVHTHNTPAQVLAALALPNPRPRMVTTEHNTDNRRRRFPLSRAFDRRLYSRYDAVVCCSEPVRTALREHLRSKSIDGRIVSITNGIDLAPYFAIAPRDARGLDNVKVVMVSAFRPQKDHRTALEAIARLPERFKLTLAGDGATRHAAESLAAKLGIQDRVEFTGNLTDIPALYARSNIAVLSTHYEGLSLTTIEAMASGVPFIASDVAGVRENICGGAMLVAENDPAALADAIKAIADNPDLAHSLSQKGRAAAENYNIENTVNEYITLYNSI
ncbi:MAG: glycosyltransferase [Duncaniella sp.]|nr:glycosyltransferase [Duncaniella sp.]